MKKMRTFTLMIFILAFILIIIRAITHLQLEPGETTNLWLSILPTLLVALAAILVLIDRQKEEKGKKEAWIYKVVWLFPVLLVITVILEVMNVGV